LGKIVRQPQGGFFDSHCRNALNKGHIPDSFLNLPFGFDVDQQNSSSVTFTKFIEVDGLPYKLAGRKDYGRRSLGSGIHITLPPHIQICTHADQIKLPYSVYTMELSEIIMMKFIRDIGKTQYTVTDR